MRAPLLPVACLLALPPLAAAVPAPPPLDAAWELGAQLAFADSARAFAQVGAAREARLGRAVMLLNAQPKSAAHVATARALLTALRTEQPDDEPGIAALYYLARIAQFHEEKPDLATARTRFGELAARHEDNFYGQLARLKLATLELYAPAAPATAAIDRVTAAETLGAPLRHAAIARDFHLLVAEACLRFDLPLGRALDHFLAADATGAPVREIVRSSLFIQIAECARQSGRAAIAHRYYRRFLAEFPRDARGATVRDRLAALPPEDGP
jgi:hypothetical protein